MFPFVFVPGENVLEIGAGSGRDTAILLELGVGVAAGTCGLVAEGYRKKEATHKPAGDLKIAMVANARLILFF